MEASIFEQLAAPIEKGDIKKKRIQWTDKKTGEKKSYETDYITARTVMNRLDRVVGPDNWSDDYIDRANGSVRCILSVRINDEWISKSDVGTETDIEGDKGAYSDAFKRAAVKWGIGRELYDEGTAYEPAPSKGASQHAPTQNAKRSTPKPPQAQPASNQPAQHWIKDAKSRSAFWRWTHDDMQLTNEEVHATLGVEKVEQYTGTKEQAMAAIKEYAAKKAEAMQAVDEQTTLDEYFGPRDKRSEDAIAAIQGA